MSNTIERSGYTLKECKLIGRDFDEFFAEALQHEKTNPIPEKESLAKNTDPAGVRAAAREFVLYIRECFPAGGVYIDLVNRTGVVPLKEYSAHGTPYNTPERAIRILYIRPGFWTWEADGGGYIQTDAGGSVSPLAKWIRFGFTFA